MVVLYSAICHPTGFFKSSALQARRLQNAQMTHGAVIMSSAQTEIAPGQVNMDWLRKQLIFQVVVRDYAQNEKGAISVVATLQVRISDKEDFIECWIPPLNGMLETAIYTGISLREKSVDPLEEILRQIAVMYERTAADMAKSKRIVEIVAPIVTDIEDIHHILGTGKNTALETHSLIINRAKELWASASELLRLLPIVDAELMTHKQLRAIQSGHLVPAKIDTMRSPLQKLLEEMNAQC